jgi:hypothetical protein
MHGSPAASARGYSPDCQCHAGIRPRPTNRPGSARRAPRLPQLRQVGIPTRSFELERLSSIERFVNQPSKSEIDSFPLGLQAITAHHLTHETIVQFHIGAHLYTMVHQDRAEGFGCPCFKPAESTRKCGRQVRGNEPTRHHLPPGTGRRLPLPPCATRQLQPRYR